MREVSFEKEKKYLKLSIVVFAGGGVRRYVLSQFQIDGVEQIG